jgi:CO/xanthine dehydrogenase FAD-binding subunit
VYFRPETVAEAVDYLTMPGVQVIAGGTDFYPSLGEGAVRTPVMDISRLSELRGVVGAGQFLRIGGLTTWTDILRSPLPRSFDSLKAAAREVGSVQIQNRGTVAGNLCNASPAADGVPPLLALDAEVELTSRAGPRRMSLASFLVGNRQTQRRADELLTAIWIPRSLENARSSFLKLGARRYLVISISMVAVVLEADAAKVAGVRVAVGSCSAVARRLTGLENDLVGATVDRRLSSLVTPQHLLPLSPIDDGRATADYRRDVSLTLVRRSLDACLEDC